MVLRGRTIHRNGHGRCGLLSIKSFFPAHSERAVFASSEATTACSLALARDPAHASFERSTLSMCGMAARYRMADSRHNRDSRGAHASV
jgi:hypothetical protein